VNWEYIHLISHPFAIVLPLVGAVVGLAGWAAGRDDLERYGVLSILLGGIAALPSYYSGITAADEVAQRTFVAPGVVQDHRTWATWAAVLLVTSAIFAGYSLFQPAEKRLRRFVLVAGSTAALVTALAAFRGGQIEHGADSADEPSTPAVLEESIQ
jgi:uncharacterized membrane protein